MDEQPPESIRLGPYRLSPEQIHALMTEDGVSMWLLNEAAWSVALDNDPRCRTVSLEDLSPEQQEYYRTRDGKPETD